MDAIEWRLHVLLFAHFQSGQIYILDSLAQRSVKKKEKKKEAWVRACVCLPQINRT